MLHLARVPQNEANCLAAFHLYQGGGEAHIVAHFQRDGARYLAWVAWSANCCNATTAVPMAVPPFWLVASR